MVQILSGLITYLLLAIYCDEQHGETVSIRRVLELRTLIRNEALQQAAEVWEELTRLSVSQMEISYTLVGKKPDR